jgi:hypothetical protein
MYQRLVLFVTLWLLPAAVQAQMGTGHLTGTIADERGRPIKGATVTAANDAYFPKSFTSATDAKGHFSLLGLRTATYTITVRAEGFEVVTLSTPVRMAQPNPPVDLRLLRKPDPGPPPVLGGVDAQKLQASLDTAAGLAASGKTDEAIAAYKRILRETPALTSINLQLGYLYERKGDRAAAMAAYETALKGDPLNATARDALNRLRSAGRQ